jgi:hypothetical protein
VAVDTINEKLALMEMENVWEPGLPMSPGTLGQDDQQQLLWGYPGILWSAAFLAEGLARVAFIVKIPEAGMTAKKPSAEMTSRKPDMSATGRGV